MADGMCICMGCAATGPTTTICACAIDQSKTLFVDITAACPRLASLVGGTYALAYAPAPGPSGGVCPPFGTYGEGWFYEDANFFIGFILPCGLTGCNKALGACGSSAASVVSCSPLLIHFSGSLLTGDVYE